MNHYFLHGKIKAKTGHGTQLSDILLQASQTVQTAKGCLLYLIAKDEQDPDSVWITEVWESKEDHDDSLKLEPVRALIGTAMPIIDGPPQRGQELKVIGGIGLSH